jgi:adenine-specific DNA-methyltransferase
MRFRANQHLSKLHPMASLSRTYDARKLLGQVYTPPHIVNKILDEAGLISTHFLGKTILDPACGDGRFLLKVVQRIVHYSPSATLQENLQKVQGWDIDPEALAQCREALDDEIESTGLCIDWNLREQDALLQLGSGQRFDFIVGNPPYIRIQHLPESQRRYLQEHYLFCRSGSTDTYVAFFELADRLLATTGICGYITPNSYFFSETARPLRRYFQERQNLQLVTNYGSIRVFDKTGTYAAITVFDKQPHDQFRYELSSPDFTYPSRWIPFQELHRSDLWQLSVQAPPPGDGIGLGDICQISVGLTTLSDAVYLFKIQEGTFGDCVPGISKAGADVLLEKEILKPIIKASRLKRPTDPITDHILFPYQKNEAGKHVIIPEPELKKRFPKAYAYLLSQKSTLDRRDNGKPNPVAWYAFGRAQSLDASFGKKIIFSPMNRAPNFILHEAHEATLYSGYFIKYEGDYEKLLPLLNSSAMADYMAVAGRDFRGGWKGYSKKIVENFRFPAEALG